MDAELVLCAVNVLYGGLEVVGVERAVAVVVDGALYVAHMRHVFNWREVLRVGVSDDLSFTGGEDWFFCAVV